MNGGDPKKQSESSLNDSQNVGDIFAEGLSSPVCVSMLVNCIKKVKKQSFEIFS